MKDYFFDEINEKIKHVTKLPHWLQNYLPFAKQIKVIRTALGMTQQQLAKKINTTQETIARLEAGAQEPNVSTLRKVARAFQADLQILIVPKKPLKSILQEKAEKKARKMVSLSRGSNMLEAQKPSKKAVQKQVRELKKEILAERKTSLWD